MQHSNDKPTADFFTICQLDSLGDAHKAMLEAVLKPIRIKAGVGLVGRGTGKGQVLFITEGRIKVLLRNTDRAPLVFGTFGSGSILSNLWKQQSQTMMHVETLEETCMWSMSGDDFEQILRTEPDLAIELLKRFERDSHRRWQHTLARLHQFC